MADVHEFAGEPSPLELPHFPGLATMARAQNECGAILDKGLQQSIVILKVVLQVGILNKHKIAMRECKTGSDGMPFATRLVIEHNSNPRMIAIPFHDLPCAVGR